MRKQMKIETRKIKKLEKQIIKFSTTDVIKSETNIIEFPIFTLNKNVKKNTIYKYIFNSDNTSYLEVIPPVTNEEGVTTIPGEFDQKVFYALNRMLQQQGNNPVYCTSTQILKEMGYSKIGNKEYINIEKSLEKLQATNYKFENCFNFNSEIEKTISRFNLITYSEVTFKDFKKIPEEYQYLLKDKRVKNIFEIHFNQIYMKNLTKSGNYLSFNKKVLDTLKKKQQLSLILYQFLTLKRAKKLKISIPFVVLASRIPYKVDSSNKYYAKKKITESLTYLEKEGLILFFEEIGGNRIEETVFEINFTESNNEIDYNSEEIEDIMQTENYQICDISNIPNIPSRLLNLIPEDYQNSSILAILQSNLDKGINYLTAAIKKVNTMKWKNESLTFYNKLKLVIENNWAEGDQYEEEVKVKEVKKKIDGEKQKEQSLKNRKIKIVKTMGKEETKNFLNKFLVLIELEIPQAQFDTFFKDLRLLEFSDEKIVIVVRSRDLGMYFKKEFSELIKKSVYKILKKEVAIEYEIFSVDFD